MGCAFRVNGCLPLRRSPQQVGGWHRQPPAITHPEYYYGFVCVGLAWQVLYLVLASEPLRYRPMMLVGILEKASGIVFILLVLLHRSPLSMLIGIVDVLLGILFWLAYIRTAPARLQQQMLPMKS